MRKIFTHLVEDNMLSKSGVLDKWTGYSGFVSDVSSTDVFNLLWSLEQQTYFDKCCLNYLTPKITLSLQKFLDFRYLYIRWANVKIKLLLVVCIFKLLGCRRVVFHFHCRLQAIYDILRWCGVSCMLLPIWHFCEPSRVLLCVVCLHLLRQWGVKPHTCGSASLELPAGESGLGMVFCCEWWDCALKWFHLTNWHRLCLLRDFSSGKMPAM